MLFHHLLPLLSLLAVPSTFAAPRKRADPVRASPLPALGGFNIAGLEFAIEVNGTWGLDGKGVLDPGTDQIPHFTETAAALDPPRNVNLFRIPFAWQPMVGRGKAPGGPLDTTFLAQYDAVVQAALATGAYVIVDCHNYARWEAKIIGSADAGGASNSDFASLWSQLATHYASDKNVIFGLMNEPHDMNGMDSWAATLDAAIQGIRKAEEAASNGIYHHIMLSGDNWSHTKEWTTANKPILDLIDPAGGQDLLLLDIHEYLDGSGGKGIECSKDNVDLFTDFSSWLKTAKRQAILSETGGGLSTSCHTYLTAELKYVSTVSDTILGFAAWSAGAFTAPYELLLTPVKSGDSYVDNAVVTDMIYPNLPLKGGASSGSPPAGGDTPAQPATSAASVTSSVVAPPSVPSVSPPAAAAQTSAAPVAGNAITTDTASGANLQTYTGAVGGKAAPKVTAAGNGNYKVDGTTSVLPLYWALRESCWKQQEACNAYANEVHDLSLMELQCQNQGAQFTACMAVAEAVPH